MTTAEQRNLGSEREGVSWHQRSVADTLRLLETSDSGLASEEAIRRLQSYGENIFERRRADSAAIIFFRQFKDFMVLLLLAASLVSGAIGELTDTIVIAAVLVLNAAIGFTQEYRAERAMEALRNMAAPHAT